MSENNIKTIKHTITRLLAGREHSKKELLKKLLVREFEYELSVLWIEKFSEDNLQSEERFTESFIRGRTNKGIGEVRIRNELKDHEIPIELIKQVMKELDTDWFELAVKVFHKRFTGQVSKEWKDQQKQQRFMLYRGFTHEQIKYALQSKDE